MTTLHVPGRFEGRTALVTGAANGIGRACVERLRAEGATVGIIDLNGDEANTAAEEIGGDVRAYECDVTDAGQVRAAFDDFEKQTGKIDVLVNMAGIFPQIPFYDLSFQDWEKIVAVNLDASFITCQDAMRRMRERGYGRITTVSSGTVHLGTHSSAAYIAAKSGIIGLTRVLAREGGPDGITANVIMPGVIMTPKSMASTPGKSDPKVLDGLMAVQCVRRLGRPEDIAEAVAYATCEGAGFLTGQTLNVGGGVSFV